LIVFPRWRDCLTENWPSRSVDRQLTTHRTFPCKIRRTFSHATASAARSFTYALSKATNSATGSILDSLAELSSRYA
jgi:hypothetical protein